MRRKFAYRGVMEVNKTLKKKKDTVHSVHNKVVSNKVAISQN